ncbi:hypothetical protein CF319_g6186 [Tilletia indica]|nr:hypothetical protein CF319_g6186 [Tilletia indica]
MDITKDDLDARTAYDLLGLTSSATLTEIRSAYLTLVRLYHPDKQSSRLGPTSSLSTSASSGPPLLPGQGENEPEGRRTGGGDPLIVRLNEAYATLSSSEGRAAYDARLLSSSSSFSHRQQEVGARISATVDLDDFEVKHVDELDSGNQASSSAQSQATDLTSVDNKAVQEDDDGSGDEDDAGGSSPIVFVYPCRCGHAFIVHPDELLTTATTSDTTDGIANLASFDDLEGPQISSNDQDGSSSATTQAGITTSMSMLSTCPGCSQVIKVVWGHTDDVDDDIKGETRGEDVQIAQREK